MLMWKPTGRIRCLAARLTSSAIAPGRSMSPLLLSAKFLAQSELNDFFLASSALPLQAKNGHDLFFFSKAFEPILRHVLREKAL